MNPNELLEATTTRSIFFRNTDADRPGKRLPAGTSVTVKENRRGEMVARVRLEGWAFGKAIVSRDDVECP